MYADLIDPALALRPAQPAAQTLAALTPSGYAPAVPGTIRKANEVPSNMIGPAAPSSGGTGGVTAAQVRQDNAAGAAEIARREEKGAFAPAGFASALGRTFHEEGGFNARDANGAPVNFGINQAAHPEVDVSKLTREQAAAIYKRDYWDKIGGDALAQQNPALAHVAFDMAVVAGPGRALEMIKQSGGDAAKFMDLRALYLEGLVRSDPATYGKYAQTWRSRDQHLREDLAGGTASKSPGFTMEIAEGPAMTMTDATTAPVQASDAASLEPPPEIRAALGLPPVTPQNVESPEQIIPPEIRKALGMPETGGYQTDANGNLAVKLDKPQADPTEVEGVTEFGEPIFRDPQKQREFQQGEADFGKGVLSGMAQDVTGVGEWLPNALGGGKAAEATRYLQGVGAPIGQSFGRTLPMLAPMGEGIAAIGGAGKALSEGAPIAANLLRGLRGGAVGGALTAAPDATGEADYGKRLLEKGKDVGESTVLGGVIGGAGAGVTGLWRGAEDLARTFTGGYGREAAAAGKDLSAEAAARVGGAEREADREVKTAALGERSEGRRLAAHEEAYARAEQHAQKIAQDFAARPTMTSDVLGNQIHEAALRDVKETRDRLAAPVSEGGSGFADAVKADGGRPSVPTKKFIARTAEAETRAVSPAMKSTLSWLKGELRTQQPGSTITMVSTAKARRIIQELDDRIDGLKGDEKHEMLGLKKDFVKNLEEFRPDLKAAKKRYAEIARDLDPYERSGAGKKAALEDPYSGDNVVDSTRIVGALLNRTEGGADVMARLVAKNPELLKSVHGYFNRELADAAGESGVPTVEQVGRMLTRNRLALDRIRRAETKAGGATVAESGGVKVSRVDSGDPAYQSYEITDASGKKLATMQAMRKGKEFYVLDVQGASGPGSMGPRAVRGAANAVKKLHPEVETFTGNRISGAREASGADVAARVPIASREQKAPLAKDFYELKEDIGGNEAALKQAKEGREQTQKNISELAAKRSQAETARHALKTLEVDLQGAQNNKEIAAASDRIVTSLRSRGVLDDADYRKLSDHVKDVLKKEHRYEVASRLVHQAIRAAVVGALGGAGFGVEQFVSHRITP